MRVLAGLGLLIGVASASGCSPQLGSTVVTTPFATMSTPALVTEREYFDQYSDVAAAAMGGALSDADREDLWEQQGEAIVDEGYKDCSALSNGETAATNMLTTLNVTAMTQGLDQEVAQRINASNMLAAAHLLCPQFDVVADHATKDSLSSID